MTQFYQEKMDRSLVQGVIYAYSTDTLFLVYGTNLAWSISFQIFCCLPWTYMYMYGTSGDIALYYMCITLYRDNMHIQSLICGSFCDCENQCVNSIKGFHLVNYSSISVLHNLHIPFTDFSIHVVVSYFRCSPHFSFQVYQFLLLC
jgi:hypothetical protein